MECMNNSIVLPNPITQIASMPYALYLSLQGKYFVGNTGNLVFDNGKKAWGGLINPCHSGVNLHLNVWTVTNFGDSPIKAQIWFNSFPPGSATKSKLVTPANTALCPLPKPKVKLIKSDNVTKYPKDGVNAFNRIAPPDSTIAEEEDGKFIFPPGGSFIIFLSNLETPNKPVKVNIALGWWEEPISNSDKIIY